MESCSLRIALFTPFSPDIGGGSAQLRSHLQQLPHLDVQWFYLAPRPAANPNWKWLGDRFSTRELLSDLSARSGFLPGSTSRARELVSKINADLYWIVGHYEGISVAAELCSQGKKVHLTIHDDPFGTWIRSSHFTLFRPLLSPTFPKLLHAAQSIDVTSWGMRNLYRQKYRVNCFSVYLHVPVLSKLGFAPDPSRLTVGHIGTLYRPEPFRNFVSACQKIASHTKRKLRLIRIGASPELDSIAAQDPEIFESHGDLREEQAVPLLAGCDFLYAMYPAGKKYELFRRTSLPIKVSTYVQSQRPIFAHTPPDSTLACVVRKHQLGITCDRVGEHQLTHDILKLLASPVPAQNFESARADLMGLSQIQQLDAALRGESWEQFAESNCRD